ncbi:S-methyl-5-thioribose-1-phosphate isomerase, partial [Salinisphaera sp. PC39]|uniref:S-methyl-5-thioribose-1-phosphate isomerase n=1 Tax=Salinisphaera sp. PC39 TaxID=1304156 RepID=UPI00333F30A5
MRDLTATSLRIESGRLSLLDQTLLPGEERWLACDDVDTLIEQVRALRVRGAPMIAIAAALLVARRAAAGDSRAELETAVERLREARPTAVNLTHAMDRLRACLAGDDWRERTIAEAYAVFDEDRALCDAIADHGEPLIADGDRILTHCNTGGLATAGVGTALGVIRRAHERGKRISVWVGETRPLLQGGRLTAWELGRIGVPYRLITDSTVGSLMAAGEVDKVIVGADRIAANGDVANKVGTYNI